MTRSLAFAAALAVLLAAGLNPPTPARAQDDDGGEAIYDSDVAGSDEGFDDTEVDPYADSGYADDAGEADDGDVGGSDGIDDAADDGGDYVIEGAVEDEGVADEAAASGTAGGPEASAAVLAGDALLDWAKALPASRLDARLPAMGLDLWLRSHFAASYPPLWSVGDCGEQSGDAALDAGRDISLCAMADGLNTSGKGYEIVILGESAGGDILYNAAVLRGVEASIAGEPTVEPLPLLGDLPHALQE